MEPQVHMILQVLRRLRTAVGYHELGMTQHALRCLDSLGSLGKIGHFGPIVDILRGEFVRNVQNHVCVASALETAACKAPPPARYMIEMTLAACYGPFNETGRADANTRSSRLSRTSQPTTGAGEADEALALPHFARYDRSATYTAPNTAAGTICSSLLLWCSSAVQWLFGRRLWHYFW